MATRLFDEHRIRRTSCLDGAWSFKTDKENLGVSEAWFNGLRDPETVTVPSVWNTQLGLLEYEGAAWYERSFYTDGGTIRFVFGGVEIPKLLGLNTSRRNASTPSDRIRLRETREPRKYTRRRTPTPTNAPRRRRIV